MLSVVEHEKCFITLGPDHIAAQVGIRSRLSVFTGLLPHLYNYSVLETFVF